MVDEAPGSRGLILLSGFEAFGGDAINPSWQIAEALHGECIDGFTVQAACIPCAFGDALDALDRMLAAAAPSLVLALGQAAGRSELSIERVAINIDDARIPDNLGRQPVDTPVIAGAPAAYFSNLPIKAMVAALRQAGIPAGVSQTAGTFVCNHLFYGLMHRLQRRAGVRGGFMHVPLSTTQRRHAEAGSMPLDTMVNGVRIALCTALATTKDVTLSAGAEH